MAHFHSPLFHVLGLYVGQVNSRRSDSNSPCHTVRKGRRQNRSLCQRASSDNGSGSGKAEEQVRSGQGVDVEVATPLSSIAFLYCCFLRILVWLAAVLGMSGCSCMPHLHAPPCVSTGLQSTLGNGSGSLLLRGLQPPISHVRHQGIHPILLIISLAADCLHHTLHQLNAFCVPARHNGVARSLPVWRSPPISSAAHWHKAIFRFHAILHKAEAHVSKPSIGLHGSF